MYETLTSKAGAVFVFCGTGTCTGRMRDGLFGTRLPVVGRARIFDEGSFVAVKPHMIFTPFP